MSLRNKLIRLAQENPDLREDLLPLLKQAINWDEFAKPLAPSSGWQNYNNSGPRRYMRNMMSIMDSNAPHSWSITRNKAEIDKLKSKWSRKGRPVSDRGIKGIIVQNRGAFLFLGTIGGESVAVKDSRWK